MRYEWPFFTSKFEPLIIAGEQAAVLLVPMMETGVGMELKW